MKKTFGSFMWACTVIAAMCSMPPSAQAITVKITDLGTLGGNGTARASVINESGRIAGSSYTATGEVHAFIWENGVMTDIGTLGGSDCIVSDINDNGQVVGGFGYAGAYKAYIWSDGVMTDIGNLGYGWCLARAINESGQVVGDSAISASESRAFLWQDGTMTDLGTLGGTYSVAYDINDAGQVVGYSGTASGDTHAFLWENGVMTDLGTLYNIYSSNAQFLNNAGQVAGTSNNTSGNPLAFFWENGEMTDIVGYYSYASGINEAGQVAGYRYNWSISEGFIWDNGTLTFIGGLSTFGSQPYGMNNAGQLVGTSNVPAEIAHDTHAFYWDAGVMTDLGTLGGNYASASAINDSGKIVGFSRNSSGELRATLWEILPYTTVGIDVIPYDDTNSIDMGKAKTVPVAILSSATFDAADVDPAAVLLESAPVKQKHNGDYIYSFEDVNTDGLADMVCEIDASQLTLPSGVSNVLLQGSTYSAEPIRGEGFINNTN